MKKILLIATLIIATIANAQQADKAKNLLDEVNSKMSAYNNIYIDFIWELRKCMMVARLIL